MSEEKKPSRLTEAFSKVLALSIYILFILVTLSGLEVICYEYLKLEEESIALYLGLLIIYCVIEWNWMSKYKGRISWLNAFPYVSILTIVVSLIAFMITSIYTLLCAVSLFVLLGLLLYSRVVELKKILVEQDTEFNNN